jgi:hypothetical protein
VDAGGGHLVEGWSFWGQGQEVDMTTDEILKMYSAVAGFNENDGPPGNNPTDQGSTLQAGLGYLQKTGLSGIKSGPFGELNVKKTNNWQQALAELGPLMIGVGVGDAEQEAFENGQMWVEQPSPNEEDHCVILCGYQPGSYWCWTWGGLQGMTPGWFEQNCAEVWGVVSQEWVSKAKGTDPEGVDLEVLGQQYATLTGQPNPFAS